MLGGRLSAQSELRKSLNVMVGGPLRKTAKQHVIDTSLGGRQFSGNGTYGDAGGAVRRKRIDAGGYCRERNRGEAMLRSNLQSRAVAGREQLILVRSATAPHWTNGMNHVFGRKPVTARDLRRAGFAAAERSAFGQQIGTRPAVDSAVHAATTKQRAVRRIDDGVDAKRGDVGNSDFQPGRAYCRGDKR